MRIIVTVIEKLLFAAGFTSVSELVDLTSWIGLAQVLSVLNCWLKCMLLDPLTQADHPECKSRPDTGLSAITELDPGYITGL